MKKRTVEEKQQMIVEACEMFKEASALIKKAQWNFHLCGIETCDSFRSEDVKEWESGSCNVQIFKGIQKFAKIVNVETYFNKDCITEKHNKSRMLVNYGDLVFLQVADRCQCKYKYR